MMLERSRMMVFADIFFRKNNSCVSEDQVIHCRCSRAFNQWASIIEWISLCRKSQETSKWMWNVWILFSLLPFRDRELYRADNRLIAIELSDSDGQGKFCNMFHLSFVKCTRTVIAPKSISGITSGKYTGTSRRDNYTTVLLHLQMKTSRKRSYLMKKLS